MGVVHQYLWWVVFARKVKINNLSYPLKIKISATLHQIG